MAGASLKLALDGQVSNLPHNDESDDAVFIDMDLAFGFYDLVLTFDFLNLT